MELYKKGQKIFISQYNEFQTVDEDILKDTNFTTNNRSHSYSGIHVISKKLENNDSKGIDQAVK